MNWRMVKRAVFTRHCHPWSAWSRWASTPLALVPVWRRSWRDAALVGVWLAVNPVVFGRRAAPAALATSIQMALLLVYRELMACYHDRGGRA